MPTPTTPLADTADQPNTPARALRRLRTSIVDRLETACGRVGHRYGCQLTRWSVALNDRWHLDRWPTTTDTTTTKETV